MLRVAYDIGELHHRVVALVERLVVERVGGHGRLLGTERARPSLEGGERGVGDERRGHVVCPAHDVVAGDRRPQGTDGLCDGIVVIAQ